MSAFAGAGAEVVTTLDFQVPHLSRATLEFGTTDFALFTGLSFVGEFCGVSKV